MAAGLHQLTTEEWLVAEGLYMYVYLCYLVLFILSREGKKTHQAMGITVQSVERQREELEEFCQMLLARAVGVHSRKGAVGVHSRKGEEGVEKRRKNKEEEEEEEEEEKVVCVTSGVSFLGLALVNHLLARGYSVRVILHNQQDKEKLKEKETSGELRGINNNLEAVIANLNEVKSLEEAFDGCHGVFHTSSFIDPAGLSGYSKSMAKLEEEASENVMEACARTPSVKKCVLTSSLLACIWRDTSLTHLSPLINHDSWSHESLCIDKKLWYALGKLRAEKAAWRIAEQRGLKLTTICPGLITGPEFCHKNTTATIAYLKGAEEMFGGGLLATVDVHKLAEAHVSVYKEMNKTASGRYICFDRVMEREDELENFAKEIGMLGRKISIDASLDFTTRFELSKRKLSSLMSRTMQQRC